MSFISFFLVFVLFISLPPPPLVEPSSKILHESGESGYSCFLPDLREKSFSFSPLSMIVAVGFCRYSFSG